MMALLQFSEEELREILVHLPQVRITAFAAACASRLAREVSHLERGTEADQALTDAGVALWRKIDSGHSFDSESVEARLMGVMPDELADGEFTAAVVEDATASMVYAMRSCRSDNVQNAAWAARRVYETADRYASGFLNEFEYGESAEAQILQNPVVQLELSRQARDLTLLQSDRTEVDIFADLQGKRERVLGQVKFG
jgi:hypothetical protein